MTFLVCVGVFVALACLGVPLVALGIFAALEHGDSAARAAKRRGFIKEAPRV